MYQGFFNSLNCKSYRVDIIPDLSQNVEEIPLAANNPFVVTYDTSNTPFEPVRKSRATINIVYDEYLADALTSCAQGTKVQLVEIPAPGSERIVWTGFLTPNTLNAGYENCYETFSLEASDCLSSLQYIDYEFLSGGGLTNVKDIIISIVESCKDIDGFYWSRSKRVNNTVLLPNHLIISEHNFTTNDTEEKWKMSEVLEELCKYLGFTCLQIGRYMYFIDYQVLEGNNSIYMNYYLKSSNYSEGGPNYYGSGLTITADDVMGAGATISFEGIYNHVQVKDNLYAADEFITNPFDDDHLTNRNGDFYTSVEIPALRRAPNLPSSVSQEDYVGMYPNGTSWFSQDYDKEKTRDVTNETDKEVSLRDDWFTYMHRLYDNDDWESVYYNSAGTQLSLTSAQTANSAITRDYLGATIVDMGVVRNAYVTHDTWQRIVPSRMDYTRYLCISEKHNNDQGWLNHASVGSNLTGKVVFRLKSPYVPKVMLGDDSFLVFSYTGIWERYWNRNYINPEWNDTKMKAAWTLMGDYKYDLPRARFRLKIGNKCWSTHNNTWVNYGDTYDYMEPAAKWEDNKFNFWNQEMTILNNVSWEDQINAEGIKIPMSGVDVTQGIEFEVLNPRPLVMGNTQSPNYEYKFLDFNEYVWLKDITLKCMQANQDEEGNEGDVIFENSLSGCSVNDYDSMTLKVTTYQPKLKPSYSHMVYKRLNGDTPVFLTAIKENALSGNAQKPEENIIEKYVHQYSTPTKKITMTLPIDISPLDKVKGIDVEDTSAYYVQLGTEIDYRTDRQTITYLEKVKQWNS